MMKRFKFQGRKHLINVDHYLMSFVRQEHPGIERITFFQMDNRRNGLPAPPRGVFQGLYEPR